MLPITPLTKVTAYLARQEPRCNGGSKLKTKKWGLNSVAEIETGWCNQKLTDDPDSSWPDFWEWLLGAISEVQAAAFPMV